MISNCGSHRRHSQTTASVPYYVFTHDATPDIPTIRQADYSADHLLSHLPSSHFFHPPTSPLPKMSLTNPTKQETHTLLTTLESHFPSDTLGASKWYILALASIVAGGHPALSADLYLHLISRPEYSSPESRQALVRKLREVLVKLVAVIGVPKCIDAVFAIAGVEREEDRDWSFSR